MYALTVKAPWAQAIARFGKDVENRSRRPPAAMLGQRIAIHVGKAWDAWLAITAEGLLPSDHPTLPPAMLDWMDAQDERGLPPDAGRIIATARVIGWTAPPDDMLVHGLKNYDRVHGAPSSPWFTGPIGWVLADVVALPVAVGRHCTGCSSTGVNEVYAQDRPESEPYLATVACLACHGDKARPIRGQLGAWHLAPEVEREVLRQEAAGRL